MHPYVHERGRLCCTRSPSLRALRRFVAFLLLFTFSHKAAALVLGVVCQGPEETPLRLPPSTHRGCPWHGTRRCALMRRPLGPRPRTQDRPQPGTPRGHRPPSVALLSSEDWLAVWDSRARGLGEPCDSPVPVVLSGSQQSCSSCFPRRPVHPSNQISREPRVLPNTQVTFNKDGSFVGFGVPSGPDQPEMQDGAPGMHGVRPPSA